LLLGEGGAGARTQLSMPGLLHAAIHRVYTDQGADAARALVGELRRLHAQAQAATENGDREASAARIRAVHAEEVRIVLGVFGEGLAGRVVDAVVADADQLRREVVEAEADGRQLPRAHELLAHIDSLLARGGSALERGDAAGALDAAARAAASADAVRHVIADASRALTIDDLFQNALARDRQLSGSASPSTTARYDVLKATADAAVKAGNRDRAHDALKAARTEQIRIVIDVLGPAAADRMLAVLKERSEAARAGVTHARAVGRDVYRLERMLESVRDLTSRAQRARAAGDAATALDLGSHAATLVNALHIALNSD
jgi:hypothetical protein